MIYLDNAATSFPKPPEVALAITRHLNDEAVNPGRSGFDLSLKAGARIDDLRQRLAQYFNHPDNDPNRVIFTNNATEALNIAIQGLCQPGDHIVSTVLEHNSVLRPLFELQKHGISHDLAQCDSRGFVDPKAIETLIKPETRLVVMTHASNVLGTIQPVKAVGTLCSQRGIHFLLDSAQTAGIVPIDMVAMGVDLLAFTGHKGLMGPTGTGGLLVSGQGNIKPTRWGGTGVRSAVRTHLEQYPYRLEAGTLNTTGLAGLSAGLSWVQSNNPVNIKKKVCTHLLNGLTEISGIQVIGLESGESDWAALDRTAVFSIRIKRMAPDKIGMFLDADSDIAVRTGLHCAPLVHEAMGTADGGAVRISPGPFTTEVEIDTLLEALASF